MTCSDAPIKADPLFSETTRTKTVCAMGPISGLLFDDLWLAAAFALSLHRFMVSFGTLETKQAPGPAGPEL